MRTFLFAALLALAAPAPLALAEPMDVNAGAAPIEGQAVYEAFHKKPGIDRIVSHLVLLYKTDPRIKDIFAASDDEHLKAMLSEQICYIAGGPCHYSGKDMKAAHANMGVQTADFNALVQDLQTAMDGEHVANWAQNRLLAKLAPMKRVVVTH